MEKEKKTKEMKEIEERNAKSMKFALENRESLRIYKKIKLFIEEDLSWIYPERAQEIDSWITVLKMFESYELAIAGYYTEYISAFGEISYNEEEIWESIKNQIISDLSSGFIPE